MSNGSPDVRDDGEWGPDVSLFWVVVVADNMFDVLVFEPVRKIGLGDADSAWIEPYDDDNDWLDCLLLEVDMVAKKRRFRLNKQI